MRSLIAVLTLAVLLGLAPAQDRPALRLIATEADAWALADQDAAKQPAHDLPYLRWLWVDSGDTDDLRVASLDLNEVLGRGTLIVRPVPVEGITKTGAKVLLARLDLRHYAPQQDHQRQKDLEDHVRTWEELAFEPRNSFLFTADTLKFATSYLTDPERIAYARVWKEVPAAQPYVQDGRTYTHRWGKVDVTVKVGELPHLKNVIVARVFGDHLDPAVVERLTYATHSQAVLTSLSYFHFRAQATIKDEAVNPTFAALFGGLYYDFANIGTKFAKGTDLDNFLAQAGIGDVSQGRDFRKVFDELRSDQKVAMAHSKVTDSERAVFIMPALLGRVGDSQPLVRLTFDLKKSSIDHGQAPMKNLLRDRADAHEAFRPKRNGLQDRALFNGEGARQDEAPFDVAKNHSAPSPSLGRLQTIDCLHCHNAEGSDGFKRLQNDALTLFKAKLEFQGDLTQHDRSLLDQQDRVYGAFTGDPERAFQRGRDDLARAVLKATGPWKSSTRGQADVVQLAAKRQVKLWQEYDRPVDPVGALRWFGFEASKEDAPSILKALLPPDKRNLNYFGVPEDPTLILLQNGVSVVRTDLALSYAPAASRARQRLAELRSKR